MMSGKNQAPSDEPLSGLPLVKAPESIWASIETAVNAGARPRSNHLLRRLLWPVLVAASLVIASGLYWGFRHGAKPRWEVVRLEGAPSIGSRHIGETGVIAEGQWLETDAGSKAVIQVGSIGSVEVDSNSRVRLLAAGPNEHRLALAHGRISATVTAPPRLFFVETSSSTAVDLGCAYTMDADDAGNGLMRVTLGWVSLEHNGRESLVPAGASCRTRAGVGPGTPFFDDAADSLKRALTEIDFEKAGRGALEKVLSAARVRDTLTLWHLLSRVDGADRVRVYTRMVALAPVPDSISPAKILQLDPETLKHWREELAWKW